MTIIVSYVLILLTLLLLSAFFSGSETALFSLGKADLGRLEESKDKRSKKIAGLMKTPQKILITILLGNLFVNFFFSQISTNLFMKYFGNYGHWISLLVVTPLIIVFCEITPKIFSMNNAEIFSKAIIGLLSIFHNLFYPLRIVFTALTNILIKILRLDQYDDENITEKELDKAVELYENSGVLLPEESSFIKNVLRFSRKNAENVMIPRHEAIAISSEATLQEAIELFNDKGVVRIPVFKEDMDNIIGGIDARDILPYAVGMKKTKTLKKFIFPITHYPESIELNALLNDFLQNKIQLAVVVDEYGGTSGIVTLSSIIAQLMGDQFSISEERKKQDIKKLDEKTSIVSGDLQIDDFNFYFDEEIETYETETIGGYMIEQLEHFPVKGEEIYIGKYNLKIRYIKKKRITSIEVREINT